jgi:hypothetical protein
MTSVKSYDYTHRIGYLELSWGDFAYLAARLTEMLEVYQPQVIIGVARAGLFPATALACSLRCELFPVRLTRRLNDEVISATPIWKVPVPSDIAGKVVAIVDEIADSGETLSIAKAAVQAQGAILTITAVLVSHSWTTPAPNLSALVSDAFVIFPWDRQVRVAGQWQPHPEIQAGIKAQLQGSLAADAPRTLEIRRHAMYQRPGGHLTQAGVQRARQVGMLTGPFDRVITSALPRAFETALAMGFAVDEQQDGLNQFVDGLSAELGTEPDFAAYVRAIQLAGKVADLGTAQASIWCNIAKNLPPAGRALLISHGGLIEAGVVTCLPNIEYSAWGAACQPCEGVRLYFNGTDFFQAEILRTVVAH